jgi:hypothetical protein
MANTFVVFFIDLMLNFRAPFGLHKTLFRKRLSQKRSRKVSIGLLVGPGVGGRGDGIFGIVRSGAGGIGDGILGIVGSGVGGIGDGILGIVGSGVGGIGDGIFGTVEPGVGAIGDGIVLPVPGMPGNPPGICGKGSPRSRKKFTNSLLLPNSRSPIVKAKPGSPGQLTLTCPSVAEAASFFSAAARS